MSRDRLAGEDLGRVCSRGQGIIGTKKMDYILNASEWRSREVENKIDELREAGLISFMLTGFHPSQLQNIYELLDNSSEFRSHGFRIDSGNGELALIFFAISRGNKKVLKKLVWAAKGMVRSS